MELSVETTSHLIFPAVTVCNENTVRKSLIKRLRDFADLVVLDQYITTLVDINARNINFDQQLEKKIVCPEGQFVFG